ncbi:hypothetical protein J3R82DRAFT_11222, partial [Butyriboletus roseoflavus]
VMFDTRSENEVEYVGYGDLKKIFVLTLPEDTYWKSLSDTMLVLALIVPWNTRGKSASDANVYMTLRLASVVMDVTT